MNYSIAWQIHAVSMVLSFILITSAAVINMAFKKKKWHIKVHKRLAYPGSILGVCALILAFVMIASIQGVHLSNTHGVVGLITVSLLILVPLAGNVMLKIKGTSRKKLFRTIHVWSGRLAVVMMGVTIIIGLKLRGIL